MGWKKFGAIGPTVVVLCLSAGSLIGQGTLIVDQANGALDELPGVVYTIPNHQLAQSFTPSFSAVGWVQMSGVNPMDAGSAQTLVINLRQGAYNGPILSSTVPVVIPIGGRIHNTTIFFQDNVPVAPGQVYFFEPVLQSAGPADFFVKVPSRYLEGDLWFDGRQNFGADLLFREGIVVPEPGTAWLLSVGGGALLWRWRVRSTL